MLPWWTRITPVLVWHPLYSLSKASPWCPLLVVPPYLCHLITPVPQYLLWTPADNSWASFLCSLIDNCQTTSLFHRIGLSYRTSLELSSREGGIQVGSSLTPLSSPPSLAAHRLDIIEGSVNHYLTYWCQCCSLVWWMWQIKNWSDGLDSPKEGLHIWPSALLLILQTELGTTYLVITRLGLGPLTSMKHVLLFPLKYL